MPSGAQGYVYTPVGFQQLVCSGGTAAAVGLTVPNAARVADISVEGGGGNVRYRDDGTDPTSSVGMVVSGGTVVAYSSQLTAVKLISTSGSVTVDVSYYR